MLTFIICRPCRQGLVHEVKHSSVDDVYERVKEIGHGMTGRVYQVKHRLTGEVYALKCESMLHAPCFMHAPTNQLLAAVLSGRIAPFCHS